MSGVGADFDGPIAIARAVHFAATTIMTGALVFRAAVAEPALRGEPEAGAVVQSQSRKLAWTGLAVAVFSGSMWLVLLTESLSNEGFGEAVMSGALRDVLTLTQFGIVAQVRLTLAIVLVVCLAFDRSVRLRWLGLATALCLTASIAWTGHAASTPHALGYLHLAADVMHLCALAAWIGGLLPLALLLHAGRRFRPLAWAKLLLDSARRFSVLGVASVATLTLSGIINSWILVGSFRGLIDTAYGWLLMIKLAVFAIMLAFAAVNRFYLVPELAAPPGSDAQGRALNQLTRNSVIEILLGLVVFAIVGVLGMLHPAIHLLMQQ